MLQNWLSKSVFSKQPHLDQRKNSKIDDLDEDSVDGEELLLGEPGKVHWIDGGQKKPHSCFSTYHRSKPYSTPLLWWSVLNAGLLVIIMVFAIRHTMNISRTNLYDSILTNDGKSFPSGQLSWSQTFTPLPCGNPPAEAMARGCHFDIIATAWLPPKCIDYELAAEFTALHRWQYFRNPNGTDVLGSQSGLIWTTHRWHSAHCVFMWKKLNRALVNGWPTDGECIKQQHVDHCSNHVLEAPDLDSIGRIVEIIYPPC